MIVGSGFDRRGNGLRCRGWGRCWGRHGCGTSGLISKRVGLRFDGSSRRGSRGSLFLGIGRGGNRWLVAIFLRARLHFLGSGFDGILEAFRDVRLAGCFGVLRVARLADRSRRRCSGRGLGLMSVGGGLNGVRAGVNGTGGSTSDFGDGIVFLLCGSVDILWWK